MDPTPEELPTVPEGEDPTAVDPDAVPAEDPAQEVPPEGDAAPPETTPDAEAEPDDVPPPEAVAVPEPATTPNEDLSTAVEVPDPSDAGAVDGLMPYLPYGGAALVLALVAAVALRGGNKPPALVDASAPPPADVPASGLSARLLERMSATRQALSGQFDKIFGVDRLSPELLEQLESVLLMADVGMPTTERLLDHVRTAARGVELTGAQLRETMQGEIRRILTEATAPLVPTPKGKLTVILVVGVNGSGKTTTIGKLAARLVADGKRVILAAGDTYRAAAGAQLQVWGERAGCEVIAHEEGGDPGAVVYDALDAAIARKADVLLVDTSGRLQTKRPLMEQLTKLRRVIAKRVPDGPHETLLVVDGTMGQNALSQARHFDDATPLTGVAVTKLDGTAKGGMVLALASELKLPVKLIGIGEQVEDLRDFEPEAFVQALT